MVREVGWSLDISPSAVWCSDEAQASLPMAQIVLLQAQLYWPNEMMPQPHWFIVFWKEMKRANAKGLSLSAQNCQCAI
jgi:hypothetical protein